MKDFDGKTYKTVIIGNQEWMSENLNVEHFLNGDLITEARSSWEWQNAEEEGNPAWCYFNNSPENGEKYGKLYNWFVVNDVRGLAPEGWHVPTDKEWTLLTSYLGGKLEAGYKLKGIFGWKNTTNDSNKSGFSGLPCGARMFNGIFYDYTYYSYWWSSTESSSRSAWYRSLFFGHDRVNVYSCSKGNGYSIRCLRNQII